MKRYKLSFFFWLLLVFLAHGQELPVTHYTTSDILPHNTVRTLLLSQSGSLWIGTDNGLLKKHNSSVNEYFVEEGLPLNNIWALAEDENQLLWIGTYGKGIASFDGEKFTNFSTADGLVHDEITHLKIKNELLFIGTSDGVSVMQLSDQKIMPSIPFEHEKLLRVSGFFEHHNKMYATTYNTGIFEIQIRNDTVSLKQVSQHTVIYAMTQTEQQLYASNKKYISVFNLDEISENRFPEPVKIDNTPILWDYVHTSDGDFYGAAWGIFEKEGGIAVFNKEENTFRYLPSVTSNSVISLAYDPQHQLLFAGTQDQGLFEVQLDPVVRFFPDTHQKTVDVLHFRNQKMVLYNDGLAVGDVFINAAFFKEKQQNYVRKFHNELPRYEDDFYELNYETPAADIKFYTLRASDTHIWVNTSIGLYAFTTLGDFVTYLPLHTLFFDFSPDNKLIQTHPYSGVRVHDSETSMKHIRFSRSAAITPTDVVNTLRTKERTYFLSVFRGLFAFDGNFHSYIKDSIWSEQKLKHATLYKEGIAVSNESGAIFIIPDPENFKVSHKIPRTGFHGNTITTLNHYKDWLIIGTEKGITLYKDEKQLFLDHEQGITKPIHASDVFDNTLFLATDGGMYEIALQKVIHAEPYINHIFLTKLNINGKPITAENDALELSFRQNKLEFEFVANTHPFPEKLTSEYRIKHDAPWQKTKNGNISLDYLEPASYELSVRIHDNTTDTTFTKKLLKFQIANPWYWQWWFISLSALTFVTAVLLIYERKKRIQIKRAREEIAINRRLEELKTEALIAQMNPHFIFNALNSIQYLVITNENTKAVGYLGKFAQLVRMNLNNSRRPLISLEEELQYLRIYCDIENERHGNKIDITFNIDKRIDLHETEIPPLLLQPFIENAFVHAFLPRIVNPQLTINIVPENPDRIRYTIRDNGVGIQSATKKQARPSKGISIIRERLEHFGYIPDEALRITHHETGTEVILILRKDEYEVQ